LTLEEKYFLKFLYENEKTKPLSLKEKRKIFYCYFKNSAALSLSTINLFQRKKLKLTYKKIGV